MTQLLKLLIRLYQLVLSPWLGPSCRYQPTCSQYALTCLDNHGVVEGVWLTIRRIARCHPWGGSGYDPPPPAKSRGALSARGEH